jgi:cardiolipin synthase
MFIDIVREWFFSGYVVAESLALLTTPAVLLQRRGRPRAALAWILALYAFPVLGVLMWWLFGRTRLRRKSRARRASAAEFFARHGNPPSQSETSWDREVPRQALNRSIFPSEGNAATLLLDGPEAFPAMEEAVASAERSIHALFYIWRDDRTGRRIRDRLAQKAREGVTVRVLTDSIGSPGFRRKMARSLVDAGARVATVFPSRLYPLREPRVNFVNHRKILVVDDRVAFTGGMNVADEYRYEWHDAMVRLEGPAVAALQYIFLEDWYFASNEDVDGPEPVPPRGDVSVSVVASGPDTGGWIHDALFHVINQARERVWIVTPYFIPTASLVTSLRLAAGLGVDVRLLLPGTSDVFIVQLASRAFYEELIESGVRLFEYRGPVIHAKAMLADRDFVYVGSANLDSRSFLLSFEAGCFLRDRENALKLEGYCWHLLASAEEITLERLRGAPVWKKLVESAAHLASPLL